MNTSALLIAAGVPTLMDEATFARISEAGSPAVRSILLALSFGVGTALLLRDARAWPVPRQQATTLVSLVFFGGLLGAIIPGFFAGGLVSAAAQAAPATAPRTITGALVGGFFAAALYKRSLKIHFDTSDAFASSTALGMVIGRVGCFFGHCCFGRETDLAWGVDFGDGVARIPSQLVEAAVVFALFVGLEVLRRRNLLVNRRLFAFMAAYGVARFFLETLREPIADDVGPLGIYQVFALGLVVVGVGQVVRRGRRWAPIH